MKELTVQEVRKTARNFGFRLVKQNSTLNGNAMYRLEYADSGRTCISNTSLSSAYEFLLEV